jgi:hypothetical protein
MVMSIGGMGLAVCAEISVIADRALKADALDVRLLLLVLAEGTIAVDANVAVAAGNRLSQWLIDGDEAMSRMYVLGALDALGTEVPVRAVQTLVADTVDELLTSIADSGVSYITTSIAEKVGQSRHACVGSGGLESMTGVMTVLVVNMALQAQVVVLARCASNKLCLTQNYTC